MAIKPDIQTQMNWLDLSKFSLAMVLVAFGVGQFYYYGSHPLIYGGAPHQIPTALRLLVMLAAVGAALALARLTTLGTSAWRYLMSARTEVQRMVWPSRQQTIQATVAVIVLVVLAGVFMWIVDIITQITLGRIAGGG